MRKNVHSHILRLTRATMLASRLTDRKTMLVFGTRLENSRYGEKIYSLNNEDDDRALLATKTCPRLRDHTLIYASLVEASWLCYV